MSASPFDPANLPAEAEIALNFVIETENYFLEAHVFDKDKIFVTFESAQPRGPRPDKYRSGWGSETMRKRRISTLCIKPKIADWYLRADLAEVLTRLRPWLAEFGRVIAYGGSMGGFGALNYADTMGATDVVAMNPQTAMNPATVPWETRFAAAPRQDFVGPYGDARENFLNTPRVLIFVDRHFPPDWAHVTRLVPGSYRVINVPYLQHGLPPGLAKLGLLSWLIETIAADRFTEAEFYRRIRVRRQSPRYARALYQLTAGHPRRHAVVRANLKPPRRGVTLDEE